MSRDSPISERSRSSSSSSYSSSPSTSRGKMRFNVPQVEVGAPCLRCRRGCEGLLLHVWRKICINCQCPRDLHKATIGPGSLAMERRDSQDEADERILSKYAWFPRGISVDMVKRYMDCLPVDHVPLCGSEGEKKRNKLYMEQLPPQDLDPDLCHAMTEIERKRLVKMADKFKTRACGVGTVNIAKGQKVCTQCHQGIGTGDVYITAGRSPSNAWHPLCFTCTTCKEVLVDLIYFHNDQDSKLYCGRHYADLKIPRCDGCDELIFADSLTQAENKKWHKEHFCCEKCDKPLHDETYTLKGGSVFCEPCFDKSAVDCQRCHLPVTIGSRKVTKLGLTFHEKCFTCKRCRESLFERFHYHAESDLLCEECMQPTAQCFACKKGILPTENHMKYESRAWHIQCFTCSSCKISLASRDFQDYAGGVVCHECFVQKVSKKCHLCSKPITSKGVQFNFSMFHLECFRCAVCEKVLTDEKFSEKQGSLYCQSCALKFAKLCEVCKKPITARHTIYKKKMYHFDCFKCTQCSYPIGKQSFYETSLGDILCELCAGKK